MVIHQIKIKKKKKEIFGTSERPRLVVYRSLKHIYTQIVDDEKGVTVVAASTLEPQVCSPETKNTSNKKAAELVGVSIAERAKAVGINKVVFDRGKFRFHGRVKALAEKARQGGLEF